MAERGQRLRDHGEHAPRISWTVVMMGIGVITSVVLNYAAYDTRITVLERTVLTQDATIVKNITRIDNTVGNNHDLEIRIATLERDVINTVEIVKRLDRDLGVVQRTSVAIPLKK